MKNAVPSQTLQWIANAYRSLLEKDQIDMRGVEGSKFSSFVHIVSMRPSGRV